MNLEIVLLAVLLVGVLILLGRHEFGPLPVFIGTTVLMFGWLAFGLWKFHPERSSGGREES